MLRGDGEGAAVRFSLDQGRAAGRRARAFCRCVLDDTPEPVSRPRRRQGAGRGARRARVGGGPPSRSNLLDIPAPRPLAVAA